MTARPVTQWQEILAGLSPEEAAKRILADLIHYRNRGNFELDDRKQLGNALTAWNLLKD